MLWLHIGLPKTGSSAIQAGLRRHRDSLARAGLFYGAAANEGGADWAISSGNGVRIGRHLRAPSVAGAIEDDDAQASFLSDFLSPDYPISLVSSEVLAGAAPDRLARFRDVVLKDTPVRILALVRDIEGDARSRWQQAIKRGGYDGGFADYCQSQYGEQQAQALRTYADVFGHQAMTVLHYDSIAGHLMSAVLEAVGAEAAAVDEPPVINRSLTPAETEVLAACNRMRGGSRELARRLSDHLIYSHPDRAAAHPADAAALTVLRERCGPSVVEINEAYFAGEQRLRVEAAETRAGQDADPAEVWRDLAQAMFAAFDEQGAEVRSLTVQNLVLRGRERLRKGEADAARDLMRRALALDPENAQAAALLASIGEA